MNFDLLEHIRSCRRCKPDTECWHAVTPVVCAVCGRIIRDEKPYVNVDYCPALIGKESAICFSCYKSETPHDSIKELKEAMSDFKRRVLGNSL